ncbi:phage protease [Luteolibacter sp. GHJ8]|uniref:Phage protease n=1 Tax=Luteolibacter rhizosphaerae TaxID=2989719 RepID=A0ABT3G1M0_9BACT|nr:phage protease [Luteolibacter rhizosphaerae]MCW1913729.1 phage protease [Luteolibacter rhizosphaerae]
MERDLVIGGLFCEIPAGDAPREIVFIPEGKHRITPQSHPKGIEVNVPAERGDEAAANLQASLAERLTKNVGPWTDFEHTRKYPVSSYPQSFRYEAGKGIMMAVDWSGSGRRAVESRDVRFFSPEVYLDKNGFPVGLPDRGPVGGLVTEPAFRDSPPIAASNAADDPTDQQPSATMKLLLASLGIDPAAADAETAGVRALEALKASLATATKSVTDLTTERDGLKTKLTAAETKVKEAAEKRANDLVSAAVADGRIAAKDEEMQKEYRERLTAGDTFAEKILAGLEKKGAGLDKPIIKTGQGERLTAGALDTKAQALVTAGDAKTIEEARELIFASDPKAYTDYLATLSAA